MSFLEKIRTRKEIEIAQLKAGLRDRVLVREAGDPVRPFGAALRGSAGIIAEVKRRSPSRPDMVIAASPAGLAA